MGLDQEYRAEVEKTQRATEERLLGQDAASIKRSLDDVLPFIGLLVLFVILFGFVIPVSQRIAVYVTWANYVLITYFAIRLMVEYRLSNSRDLFVREHWLDALMVIPIFGLLEEFEIAAITEQTLLEEYPGLATGSATLRNTSVAARMTKIMKIIKRSFGF
jgi:hypothetical protein